jgi:hypothetical protein
MLVDRVLMRGAGRRFVRVGHSFIRCCVGGYGPGIDDELVMLFCYERKWYHDTRPSHARQGTVGDNVNSCPLG